jgi:hypothetical protein
MEPNNPTLDTRKPLDASRPPPLEIGRSQSIMNESGRFDNEPRNLTFGIATQGLEQSTYLEDPGPTDEDLIKRSKITYWKEFELCLNLKPSSIHGKMILYWDRYLECYNTRDVYFYKPPNLQLSDVETLLAELRLLNNFDPKTISANIGIMLVVIFGFIVFLSVLVVGFVMGWTMFLIYFAPSFFVFLLLVVIITFWFAKRWTHKKYMEREADISKMLQHWNLNKFSELEIEWKVAGLGSWIEINHPVKEYGVYWKFGEDRGFTADSDAMASPTKYSGTPTIHRGYRDSWSATNPITPNIRLTPRVFMDTPAMGRHGPPVRFYQSETEGDEIVEYWDSHVVLESKEE